MEDNTKFQQMQDEMSRFEAEISSGEARAVIGAGTWDAVQARLERAGVPQIPIQPSAPGVLGPYEPSLVFPTIPPPPPPPSIMVPPQVQRLRPPMCMIGDYPAGMGMGPGMGPGLGHGMGGGIGPNMGQGLSLGMAGPHAPPPRPQPVVLSAAPQLYKQHKEDDHKKEKESKKRKREKTPPEVLLPRPEPAPAPTPAPPPPPIISMDLNAKPKKEKKNRKVIRTAGGQVWEDVTLLDWPDDDFRMFCGDLGNDVTDELLTRTFSKYSSFQRAKVIRDKRTNKSKGFGFVSFKDPGDFIKAMKEMDGRYVGSRPIKLRKSSWKNRALDVVRKKEKEKAALLSLLMSGNKS